MNCFRSLKFSPNPSKNNEAAVRVLQRNLKRPRFSVHVFEQLPPDREEANH